MIKWYRYSPVDTMFFKGSEPMEMGQNHTSSLIFPPSTETISGAIRTAYLRQKEISYEDYFKGKIAKEVVNDIGKANESATFNIIGPLFKINDKVYIPAPYSWYYLKDNEENYFDKNGKYMVNIIKAKMIESSLIKAKSRNLLWVKWNEKLKTLGGKWVKVEKDMFVKDKLTLVEPSYFYSNEERVGIGLDYSKGRKAINGMIYSFTYIRLNKNVEFIFGIDRDINLDNEGLMMLGGEKRFGKYNLIDDIELPSGNSGMFLALSSLKANESLNNCVIATGRIKYIGGWSLYKKFHKPMVGFYPAGTVFSKKFKNCIEI